MSDALALMLTTLIACSVMACGYCTREAWHQLDQPERQRDMLHLSRMIRQLGVAFAAAILLTLALLLRAT